MHVDLAFFLHPSVPVSRLSGSKREREGEMTALFLNMIISFSLWLTFLSNSYAPSFPLPTKGSVCVNMWTKCGLNRNRLCNFICFLDLKLNLKLHKNFFDHFQYRCGCWL